MSRPVLINFSVRKNHLRVLMKSRFRVSLEQGLGSCISDKLRLTGDVMLVVSGPQWVTGSDLKRMENSWWCHRASLFFCLSLTHAHTLPPEPLLPCEPFTSVSVLPPPRKWGSLKGMLSGPSCTLWPRALEQQSAGGKPKTLSLWLTSDLLLSERCREAEKKF